jgi:putative colanic acid biosynthesis UDP-glucose lipid carrier transferase
MPYRKGMIRQHGSELGIFHRLLEAVLIFVTLWLCAIGYGVDFGPHYQFAGMVAVVGFLFFAEWHSLYSSWRIGSISHEVFKITSTWLLTCSVMLTFAFLSKSSINFSRVTVLAWMFAVPFLLLSERALLRYVLRRFRKLGFNTRSIAIVGGGKSTSQLVSAINDAPWMGLHIEGVYDDADAALTGDYISGGVDELITKIQEKIIDNVYITYPMREEEKIRSLLERLADSTVSVHVVPDFFVSDLLLSRWSSLGNVPLVSVFESPIIGTSLFVKRVEDLLLGALILILISPLLFVIALAVKVTSLGPVLFKQRRYGLNGQVIEVWKFRSMCVLEDGPSVRQATKNDPRITPLGAFLRKTSLDELPQFINVLQGQMSIVGPRPHAVAHNEQYRKLIHGYMLRHKVKPGITGWAQVNGWRGETDLPHKMEMRVQYDLEYINNWSLWFDLKIIWKTVFGGMRGKNAY